MSKTSKRKTTSKVFDIRLYALPNRREALDNLDVNMRTPLSSMQLWEVKDGPVVIEAPSGDCRIFLRGEWHSMDAWEAVFEGVRMSYMMFAEKWPCLVSVDEYLASFPGDKDTGVPNGQGNDSNEAF
jgi:hypothetical protein